MTNLARTLNEKLELETFSQKLQELKIKAFRPKIKFIVRSGQYIIQTATDENDIKEVIRLRYHSFLSDFLKNVPFDWIDFNRFDLLNDHIIVRRADDFEVIGSYRVLSSSFCQQYSCASQYDLKDFLKTPGVKVELGRASIHKDFRNGAALSLVWKGLAHYANLVNAKYLFGCSSLKTTSSFVAQNTFGFLSKNHYSDEFKIEALGDYKFEDPIKPVCTIPDEEIQNFIPPLLSTYLKAGAKLFGPPTIDRQFQCTDFFTILNIETMDSKYKRRYFE